MENNPDDYYLPANLTKSELEDRLEGGFDRLAREASEAKTVDLSLPESIEVLLSSSRIYAKK